MPQKKIGKFLKKLFAILDNHQYQSIICWDGSGQCVLIKDQQKLEFEIIPRHFSLRKFSSFVRQLHLYNFHKKKSKCNDLVFYNTCFQREQRDLALRVIRKRKTKAQMMLNCEYKLSQKTIEPDGSIQHDQFNLCHLQQEVYKGKQTIQEKEEEQIKSFQSLSIISLKSFSHMEERECDPYDILNIL